MISVIKLLENKGNDIWSVSPEESVFDAIRLMEAKNIGAVAVLLDEALIGILSERDCARKMILQNLLPKETLIKDVMTRQVFYTFPEQNVEECLAVMAEHNIRHLPVVQDKKMMGMVSMGDVVKEILAKQRDKIEHLEHYVSWEESF